MIKKDDFFGPWNEVVGITDEDYSRAAYMVKAIEGVACASYQSFYVIDYFRHNFFYVSNNPLFLCGSKPKTAAEMGHGFYLKHVPESEHQLLLTVNRVGFEFFEKIPLQHRMNFMIQYEFHIKTKSNPILINQKLKPLLLDRNGHVWLAVCVVSLSANKDAGLIRMRHLGTATEWEYLLAEGRWKKLAQPKISDAEKAILIFSAQGYTMDQIADKLGLSINTIKFHKRKLFELLHVESITEALTCAINMKLI